MIGMIVKTKQKIIAKNSILIKRLNNRLFRTTRRIFFHKQINRDTTATLSVNTDEQEEEDQFSTEVSPSLQPLNTSHVSSPSSASVCISSTTNSISDQLGSMTEQFKKNCRSN
jgi:hypothetical protein